MAIFVYALFFFGFPFILTLSVNELFGTNIEFTVETWLAWIAIQIIVLCITAQPRKAEYITNEKRDKNDHG